MVKKILFLTPQLPYPPVSGGTIKSWRVVEYLSQKHSLSIGTFLKNNDEKHLNEFLQKVSLENIYYKNINIPRNVINLIKSHLIGIPLTVFRNHSEKFKETISKITSHYDCIFVDHYVMFQYIPEDYKGSIILHEHNAEYVMWKRAASIEQNVLKKILLYTEAERIKKYEKSACNNSTNILAAPNDIMQLQQLGISAGKFYETLHLGDDTLLKLPKIEFQDTKKSLLFIGSLSWEANIDGLLWFIENIWDTLKNRNPDLVFYIVGKGPDKRLKKIVEKKKDIFLAGNVDNLEDYYSKSRVFVAPLRFGSGMKVKAINAMYRGIPVVTSSIGAEGLNVKDMHHMAIADNSNKIIEDIDVLLNNQKQWESLRDKSRELAIRAYTWDRVFINIDKAINECN